jgi:hypothetical protein
METAELSSRLIIFGKVMGRDRKFPADGFKESGAGNHENSRNGSFCAYHTKSGSLPAFLYRNAGHGAKRNKWEVYIAVWRTKDKYTHAPGGIPAGGRASGCWQP